MSIQNIDNNEIKRLYQSETASTRAVGKAAGRDAAGKSGAASSSVSGKDQATVSESARLLAESLNALKDAPAVRADLVTQLRDQVESGNYEIPYDELAKRLAAVMKA